MKYSNSNMVVFLGSWEFYVVIVIILLVSVWVYLADRKERVVRRKILDVMNSIRSNHLMFVSQGIDSILARGRKNFSEDDRMLQKIAYLELLRDSVAKYYAAYNDIGRDFMLILLDQIAQTFCAADGFLEHIEAFQKCIWKSRELIAVAPRNGEEMARLQRDFDNLRAEIEKTLEPFLSC